MTTIIYRNGGEVYLGEHSDQSLSYWKHTGKVKNQKYMYKGYRYSGNSGKQTVIVFDTKQWDKYEIAKRKINGFLGIREFKI